MSKSTKNNTSKSTYPTRVPFRPKDTPINKPAKIVASNLSSVITPTLIVLWKTFKIKG